MIRLPRSKSPPLATISRNLTHSEGKILALDTVPGLIQHHGGEYKVIIQQPDKEVVINTKHPLQSIKDENINIDTDFIEVRPPNLEQVFFNLTGKQLRD